METKENILKVALKMFIERGFFEVSIKDLIEEIGIVKSDFDSYFENKDRLIYEAIEKFFFQRFDDIFKITSKSNKSSKEKLLKIFQKYSETESYLKNSIRVEKINSNSVICLVTEGVKNYESMTKCIINFNKKLLENIFVIIQEGKRSGEILNIIDSKNIAENILKELQNSIALWSINQKINIRLLYETSFKYLWSTIKCQESNFINSYDNKKETKLIGFYRK